MYKIIIAEGILQLGKIDYTGNGIKDNAVQIEYKLLKKEKGYVFSASGGVWQSNHKDYIACGQMIDEIASFFPDNEKVQTLYHIWCMYHLNDMNAGTPEQEYAIRQYLKRSEKRYDYSEICNYLKSIDLYEVPYTKDMKCAGNFPEAVVNGERGYKYGERWVYASIPENIVEKIIALDNQN